MLALGRTAGLCFVILTAVFACSEDSHDASTGHHTGGAGNHAGTGGSGDGGGDAVTTGGGGTAGAGGEPSGDLFCPPTINAAAKAWQTEYDNLIADKERLRSRLSALPAGGGHWGESYVLRSLVLMYELTGDVAYLHEVLWHANALVEAATGMSPSWPALVCESDPNGPVLHSALVTDARLVTPLLRAAWWAKNGRLKDVPIPTFDGLDFAGQTYGAWADTMASLGAAVLAGHDAEHVAIAAESFGPLQGSATSYYVFPTSYLCVAGDVMPANFLNSAGSAYVALWRLTGDTAARTRAERLFGFWYNRSYRHDPIDNSVPSRWWAYRGDLDARFEPNDLSLRPEDLGHGDLTSTFVADLYRASLDGVNATRMAQVATASKRWVDRAVATGTPAEHITNNDNNGLWTDLFDHLPMACVHGSILSDLAAEAPVRLTNGNGDYRFSFVENIAELAYFEQYAGTAACSPECGDGVCSGPEDCVGCAQDCGMCPLDCAAR